MGFNIWPFYQDNTQQKSRKLRDTLGQPADTSVVYLYCPHFSLPLSVNHGKFVLGLLPLDWTPPSPNLFVNTFLSSSAQSIGSPWLCGFSVITLLHFFHGFSARLQTSSTLELPNRQEAKKHRLLYPGRAWKYRTSWLMATVGNVFVLCSYEGRVRKADQKVCLSPSHNTRNSLLYWVALVEAKFTSTLVAWERILV